MTIDTAAILAARYHKNSAPLKAAVLGQGDANINPYAALRALQLQKEAERYEMAQAAMRGQQYQNQPSMVEQALSPTPPQMPPQMQQPQMPPQMQQPQGLPGMQQAQQSQPSQGLEGMPVPEGEYAGGGIVAFAGEDGSYVDSGDQLTPEMLADLQDKGEDSPGDPASYQSIAARLPGLLKNIENAEYKAFTPEQYKDAFTKRRALIEEGAEPSPYGELKQQIAGLEGERAQNLGQAKGLGMLVAAGAVMEPGGLARGIGRASGAFANVYGQAMQADRAEKRALMSMQFNLADAQRKEKMGLNREAIAAADQARQDHTAAQRFGLEKTKAMATVASNMARATKPSGTGGDKTPKNFDALANTYYDAAKAENDALPPEQRKSETALKKLAYKEAAGDWAKLPAGEVMDVRKREATTDEKSQAATEEDKKKQRQQEEQRLSIERERQQREARQEETNFQKAQIEWQQAETARRKAIAEEQKKLNMNRDYIRGTPEEKAQMRKDIEDKYPAAPKPQRVAPSSDAAPRPDAAPAPAPRQNAGNKNSQAKASSGKVITRADIQATAAATGRSEADVEAAAKAKGYKIK
jgi:hypothetical protein